MRWLNNHWRIARIVCLDFQGHSYKPEVDWEAPAHACAAGSARVLRVTYSGNRWLDHSGHQCDGLASGLPRWVAGVAPLCQNLTALHLKGMEVKPLPPLPLLKHIILQQCEFTPALVASLQGLARLETLHASGHWGAEPPVWDVRACTGLRRVHMGWVLAGGLAAEGQELRLPPACTVALELLQWQGVQGWLAPLGWRITDLRLLCCDNEQTLDLRTTLVHAPQLSQLRHVTLWVKREMPDPPLLCVARLLSDLPRSVQSLHLQYRLFTSEQAVAVVPASLRALRVKSVCDRSDCGPGCICPPSERTQDLTFGLHAGLERLCLVLWGVKVGLQCLDAGAPAGLRELNVQARVVDMDEPLAAEVGQRGRVLERCEVFDRRWFDRKWFTTDSVVPSVQVVHIGRGPVHMEDRKLNAVWCRERHWACTCGTCAECLGPEAFGGVVDACR